MQKNKYSILVHLAGNGKMNPNQITKVIDPILKNKADFVSVVDLLIEVVLKILHLQNFLIYIFSKFVTFIFKRKISDASCGFRAFKLNVFNNFNKNYNQERFIPMVMNITHLQNYIK